MCRRKNSRRTGAFLAADAGSKTRRWQASREHLQTADVPTATGACVISLPAIGHWKPASGSRVDPPWLLSSFAVMVGWILSWSTLRRTPITAAAPRRAFDISFNLSDSRPIIQCTDGSPCCLSSRNCALQTPRRPLPSDSSSRGTYLDSRPRTTLAT